MMPEAQRGNDLSLGELFAELTRELSTLVRQEMVLAKTEMSQKAARVGRDLGMLAAGAAVAYAGVLALVAAVILILQKMGVPGWLSALLVGVVVAGGGALLIKNGLNALKKEDLVPRQAVEALKEDVHGAATVRSRASRPG